MPQILQIRGAREHNLKNISCSFPRKCLSAVTGVSGSGKSSLVFATVFKEAWRRALLAGGSLKTSGQVQPPAVDEIAGLPFAVPILPESPRGRSHTVATWADLYTALRTLFLQLGVQHCSRCGGELERLGRNELVRTLEAEASAAQLEIRAVVVAPQGEGAEQAAERLMARGFGWARIDGELTRLETLAADGALPTELPVVVDSFTFGPAMLHRLNESLTLAVDLGGGRALLEIDESHVVQFSEQPVCTRCGASEPALLPEELAYYRAAGACSVCGGNGVEAELEPQLLLGDEESPVVAGGVLPWQRPAWQPPAEELRELLMQLNVPADAPLRTIPENVRMRLLFGSSGDRRFALPVLGEGSSRRAADADPAARRLARYGAAGVLREVYRRESRKERSAIERYLRITPCAECGGSRLGVRGRTVQLAGAAFGDLMRGTVAGAHEWCSAFADTFRDRQGLPMGAARHLRELTLRLECMIQLGLGYLSLNRGAATLSSGEAQRSRLSRELGAPLQGVLYLLDEPSIGLHPDDRARLVNVLRRLIEIGATGIMVEHDPDLIAIADYIVELGPGGGPEGGAVIAAGRLDEIRRMPCRTARLLATKRQDEIAPGTPASGYLRLAGIYFRNLKIPALELPLGQLVGFAGVSGSGKSSLLLDCVGPALSALVVRRRRSAAKDDALPQQLFDVEAIEGWDQIDKVRLASDLLRGRSRRSIALTLVGALTPLRVLFSETIEAKMSGFRPEHFSFNSPLGACATCRGTGSRLARAAPNYYVELSCPSCSGRRYRPEILQVRYRGLSIADVLNLTFAEAASHFEVLPSVPRIFSTVADLGLSYLKLGQDGLSLSLGEYQRLRLVRDLQGGGNGRTLYIFDEPSRGLHPEELPQLVAVFRRLIQSGNTVYCIDHHPELLRGTDFICELGPKAGAEGGTVIAQGTPQELRQLSASAIGRYL